MTNQGIKISISGVDVLSASDNQLVLSSKFPFLKAKAQGSLTMNVTGPGTYTTSITHNLEYFPIFMHYAVTDPTSEDYRKIGRFAADAPGGSIGIDSNCDITKLNFAWLDNSSPPGLFGTYPYDIHIYYYLFYDSLE